MVKGGVANQMSSRFEGSDPRIAKNPGGSSTADKVIDFQADVGSVQADIGVIAAYIFAGILVLVGLGGAIYGLIPREPTNCSFDINSAQSEVDTMCQNDMSKSTGSESCDTAKQKLARVKAGCAKKSPNYAALVFLLLIPLGIGIVYLAKLNRHFVKSDKSYAAVEGTMGEISELKQALSSNYY